ncbi:uncharacterized protein TNCV_921001 [Trichonephila clavipes]|nr:uncharacterized protein TNCV_921001 [Trichonephila clavipes]
MSSVRALVPQKFSVEEELMHVKHVDVKSPHVGVMWKFGRGVFSSGESTKLQFVFEAVREIYRSIFGVASFKKVDRFRSEIQLAGHPVRGLKKQVKKSSTQVITAQGAKCRNMGVVELNIRIRDFEKPWLFHVLADLEYPCILRIDFIGGSKILSDFDRKSLAIPDSQINKVVKTVEIEKK